jgi:hypothetical protein
MRSSFTIARLALVAGAAFTIAGCGSRPAATNTVSNAATFGNDLSTPMNDASAVEAVGNASTTPPPSGNMSNSAGEARPNSGGDTGGNTTVQSNITGM